MLKTKEGPGTGGQGYTLWQDFPGLHFLGLELITPPSRWLGGPPDVIYLESPVHAVPTFLLPVTEYGPQVLRCLV